MNALQYINAVSTISTIIAIVQPFTMGVDWLKIGCLMEVSIMIDICTYCVFTLYDRPSRIYLGSMLEYLHGYSWVAVCLLLSCSVVTPEFQCGYSVETVYLFLYSFSAIGYRVMMSHRTQSWCVDMSTHSRQFTGLIQNICLTNAKSHRRSHFWNFNVVEQSSNW